MTQDPIEKAKELLDKMINEISESDFHVPEFISGIPMGNGTPEYTSVLEEETRLLAKQCTIIAINEILYSLSYSKRVPYGIKAYWQSVKNEINNL